MLNFIVRNLDSLIISTIFLLLGLLPTIFDSKKIKSQNLSLKNTEINNSNIENIYNQNYIQNNYNNNQSTVIIKNTSDTSSSTDDGSLYLIILGILLLLIALIFYKYINKILMYSIIITVCSLVSSLFMHKNLIKINNYIPISGNVFNISIRNIISWLLILINWAIIFYKVNYSHVMKPFMNLIKSLDVHHINEIIKIFAFVPKNPYEGYTAFFIMISFILFMIIIFKLFISYIWLISSLKVSINASNKFWNKIYNRLNKSESQFSKTKKIWICLFAFLFILSTGIFAYMLNLFNKQVKPHKI